MSEPAAGAGDAGVQPCERAAIIGCGLMGGSFALALRRAGLARHIVGYSATPATLDTAVAHGVIDSRAGSAAEAAEQADLILLAVPVGAMAESFRAIAPVAPSHALIMDVGSTKSDVVAAARAELGDRLANFVPAHPIAGKEKAGAAAADADLYLNRRTILTPLPGTPDARIDRATALWQAIGCTVVQMAADRHDTAFAAVSHFPHLLAFAYVNGLLDQPDGASLLAYGGPGFRDFSRIAGSDPAMWRDVLLSNRDEILAQGRAFRQALDALETDLIQGDGKALAARIARASEARSGWQLSTGLPPEPACARNTPPAAGSTSR
ncbi:prephenate dehydrogenase/arogenate dehydrogenase family protein [Comamonadaceae bacterium PP-2]